MLKKLLFVAIHLLPYALAIAGGEILYSGLGLLAGGLMAYLDLSTIKRRSGD